MSDMLRIQAHKMGLEIDATMERQFMMYQELLLEWNEKMNLTAITDPIDIQNKHFLDSLTCVIPLDKEEGKLIDIGTGAGFPGVPIKITKPGIEVTLLDSLNKRIAFLDEVIKKLQLKGITAVHGRAEEFARKREYRECYDYAFARAVAKLNVLCEYCLPYVKVGGFFISQKGSDYEAEVISSVEALKKLGGKVEEILPVTIPDTDYKRTLIIVRKLHTTPTTFPRHFSKIEKAPL